MQVGGDRRGVALPVERDAARQHPVQHAAERIDVGAPVDGVVAQRLRRDERERAEPRAAARLARRVQVLDEPEVRQRRLLGRAIAAEQDVRRGDVAMDEPRGVRGVERGGHLLGDRHRARGLEDRPAAQDGAQVRAVDVAHDEIEHLVLLTRVVDVDDVRVVHRGRHARLADEALAELRVVGELRGDHLDGDAALERQLRRLVDDAHPAMRGEPLQTAATERVADTGHPPEDRAVRPRGTPTAAGRRGAGPAPVPAARAARRRTRPSAGRRSGRRAGAAR